MLHWANRCWGKIDRKRLRVSTGKDLPIREPRLPITQPFHSLRCTACVSLFPELRRSEVGSVSGSHSVQPLNPASPAHCFKTLPTNVCGAPLVPGTEGMAGVRRPRPGPQARAFQWGSVGSEQENKSVKMTRQCSKHMKKME